MEWLLLEILNGLEKLYAVRLKYAPAADQLQNCAQGWMEVALENISRPDPVEDTARIREAFRTLRASCTEWPAPAQFLAALPERKRRSQGNVVLLPEPERRENLRRLGRLVAGIAEGADHNQGRIIPNERHRAERHGEETTK